MDTSEQYIKMCDCEKIQKGHHYQYGDYFLAESTVWVIGGASFVYEADKQGFHHRLDRPVATLSQTKAEDGVLTGGLIWLPRQDQLQEMVGDNWVKAFEGFGWFANDNCADEWSFDNKLGYDSMEQLWLAFVMKEKYNKTWDGENWND